MTIFYISIFSAFSILAPVLLIFIRWQRLKEKYLPLIIMLLLGLANELLSLFNVYTHYSNAINSNLFVLIEFILTCKLFLQLHSGISRKFFHVAIALGILVWLLDNLVINNLSTNNSFFRMMASLLIVYLSIDKINQLIFFKRLGKLDKMDLLLAIGFMVFHSYKTFVESFHIFPMPLGRFFYEILWLIMNIINILSNVLFTIAILCLPKKRVFLSHLSQASSY